ncbi:MAG: hypothetical protein ACRD5H_05820 [Nitrososphaerales archaeon]
MILLKRLTQVLSERGFVGRTDLAQAARIHYSRLVGARMVGVQAICAGGHQRWEGSLRVNRRRKEICIETTIHRGMKTGSRTLNIDKSYEM